MKDFYIERGLLIFSLYIKNEMNYYLDFKKLPTTSDTFVLEILKLSPLGPKPCFPSTYSSIHFMPEMFLCEMTRECIIKEESHFPTHRYVPSYVYTYNKYFC